jgi:lysophospholipase L1-like esterase
MHLHNDVHSAMRRIIVAFIAVVWLGATHAALGVDRIRYVPLGDSYTIGQGAEPNAAWPAVLTRQLNEAGVAVELVTNPARSGYTTTEVLERELPVLEATEVDFVTLSIGTNDWIGGINTETFRRNLAAILDRVQRRLSSPKRLILTTIPDFSVTPSGARFARRSDVSAGLGAFNAVITAGAAQRGLPLVDLFSVSKAAANDSSLVSSDGLHPSAKGYAIWARAIFPQALAVLRQ